MLLYCNSREKETGAVLSSRRRKLVLYCSCFDQEKDTGTLLFSGEGRWGCIVLWRTEIVLFKFTG